MNGEKKPDTNGWSEQEMIDVNSRLIVVSAFNNTDIDLVTGWLQKCEMLTNSVDALFIIRQYKKLIQQLGGKAMNKPIMEKFYSKMIEDENFSTALSLKNMFDELVNYRLIRIIDTFKNNPVPFEKILPYGGDTVVLGPLKQDNAEFNIDIVVTMEEYSFQFFDRVFENSEKRTLNNENPALTILQKMNSSQEFIVGPRMIKTFKFPKQELEFYSFIKDFKDNLTLFIKHE